MPKTTMDGYHAYAYAIYIMAHNILLGGKKANLSRLPEEQGD